MVGRFRNFTLVVFLAVLLAALLTACGGGGKAGGGAGGAQNPAGQQQASPGAPKAGGELPKIVNLATHPVGTMLNGLGTGMVTVLSKYLPGSQFKVMPTTGPAEWLPMVSTGDVQLGVLNSWDAKMGRAGKSDYEKATGGKGSPIYLLSAGTPGLNGVVVAADSGIKQPADLKGKRFVGQFTGSAGITAQARAALANFGLQPSDVIMVSVPGVEQGVRAIIEGRADATGSTNVGMAVISELDADKGARYLSFDASPEAVQRMQEFFPSTIVQVQPGPGKPGIKEPVNLMSYDFYLVASEKLSEGAAYSVVKTLWENNAELGTMHARLKEWTTDRFVTPNPSIPYHPGAIKFYKEKGVWNAAMDAAQQKLLEKK